MKLPENSLWTYCDAITLMETKSITGGPCKICNCVDIKRTDLVKGELIIPPDRPRYENNCILNPLFPDYSLIQYLNGKHFEYMQLSPPYWVWRTMNSVGKNFNVVIWDD